MQLAPGVVAGAGDGGVLGDPQAGEGNMAEAEVLDSLSLVLWPERGSPRELLAVDAVDTCDDFISVYHLHKNCTLI